ncbi:hypothetical protein M0R45_008616 [Rubus argutus]|uniref:Uncharacterized protein n=1 Tax=Rubus argutus TaxID=59490 RepID=A0AAW1Y1S3_RUBAR
MRTAAVVQKARGWVQWIDGEEHRWAAVQVRRTSLIVVMTGQRSRRRHREEMAASDLRGDGSSGGGAWAELVELC